MTSFPALDVAIGMSFVFFLLSVVATAATEALARVLNHRARTLEAWLAHVLSSQESGAAALDAFYASPFMEALTLSSKDRARRVRVTRPSAAPSYIPASHFVSALVSGAHRVETGKETAAHAAARVHEVLRSAPLAGTPAARALDALLAESEGDLTRFRRSAESWFDDQMERLSGVYKRWTQVVTAVVAAVVVAGIDADAFRMAEKLWTDTGARQLVVSAATGTGGSETAGTAIHRLDGLPLPLGWTTWPYGSVGTVLMGLAGIAVSVLAVQLGAPFWFDTLSKIARIRSTGAPPPVTDGLRRGDGEQQRGGTGVPART